MNASFGEISALFRVKAALCASIAWFISFSISTSSLFLLGVIIGEFTKFTTSGCLVTHSCLTLAFPWNFWGPWLISWFFNLLHTLIWWPVIWQWVQKSGRVSYSMSTKKANPFLSIGSYAPNPCLNPYPPGLLLMESIHSDQKTFPF